MLLSHAKNGGKSTKHFFVEISLSLKSREVSPDPMGHWWTLYHFFHIYIYIPGSGYIWKWRLFPCCIRAKNWKLKKALIVKLCVFFLIFFSLLNETPCGIMQRRCIWPLRAPDSQDTPLLNAVEIFFQNFLGFFLHLSAESRESSLHYVAASHDSLLGKCRACSDSPLYICHARFDSMTHLQRGLKAHHWKMQEESYYFATTRMDPRN